MTVFCYRASYTVYKASDLTAVLKNVSENMPKQSNTLFKHHEMIYRFGYHHDQIALTIFGISIDAFLNI